MLPFFKRVERDIDFHAPEDKRWHGTNGPIPIRRIFPDLWPEHAKAVAEAFRQAGYAFIPTRMASGKTGTTRSRSPTSMNAVSPRRSAIWTQAHAGAATSTDTEATGVVFEGCAVSVLRHWWQGARRSFAREVILSCGAIHSPAHLLRAGIGPEGDLRPRESRCARIYPGSASNRWTTQRWASRHG